mmetsp:Transcript_27139/g.61331  ORF Transcript_27139/g.61331 Transcript_27139/m.61331 type:complete len:88 (+) Transcript_27139:1236-1499(+)
MNTGLRVCVRAWAIASSLCTKGGEVSAKGCFFGRGDSQHEWAEQCWSHRRRRYKYVGPICLCAFAHGCGWRVSLRDAFQRKGVIYEV